jgi:hypothetical protein
MFAASHLAPNLFFYSSGSSVSLHITRNIWRYSTSYRKIVICDLLTRPRERFSREHALHLQSTEPPVSPLKAIRFILDHVLMFLSSLHFRAGRFGI